MVQWASALPGQQTAKVHQSNVDVSEAHKKVADYGFKTALFKMVGVDDRDLSDPQIAEMFRGHKMAVGGDIFEGESFIDGASMLYADVTTAKTVTVENEIQKHPVEEGFEISDESVNKDLKIRLEGKVVGSVIGGKITAFDDYDGNNRIELKWEAMKSMVVNLADISLSGPDGVVEGLKCSKIQRREDDSTGGFDFTATLERINTVRSQTVEVPREILVRDVKDSAQSKKDKGKGSSSNVEEEEVNFSENQAFASSIADAIIGKSVKEKQDEILDKAKEDAQQLHKDISGNATPVNY